MGKYRKGVVESAIDSAIEIFTGTVLEAVEEVKETVDDVTTDTKEESNGKRVGNTIRTAKEGTQAGRMVRTESGHESGGVSKPAKQSEKSKPAASESGKKDDAKSDDEESGDDE